MGYKIAWGERAYLARLVALPGLIKMICFGVIMALGWEQQFVRQAIVMLPSYFADGWLFAHLVRFVFFEQRWPFRPTGDAEKDMPVLEDRALGIMRGALTFVVIKFLVAGVTAIIYSIGQTEIDAEAQEVGLGVFVLALAFFVFFFWAFRLLWLYIPAAVNYPIRRFLLDLGGYSASWNLIGVWLVCFVPSFFLFGRVLSELLVAAAEGPADMGTQFSIIVLHMLLDTLVGVFTTCGLAYGIKTYVLPGPKNRSRNKSV